MNPMQALRTGDGRFRSRFSVLFPALAILGCCVLTSPSPRKETAQRNPPRPTEHWLDEGAEARQKRARQEYYEGMHRAAPGVDWRAVEKRNGLAAMERKRQAVMNPSANARKGAWRELGSRNLAGRMHAAAWSPDGQALYAGSSRGGMWRSDRDGKSWTPLGDQLYGGAFEIGIVPNVSGQPDILIRLYGDMVHRSTDQGATWTVPSGLENLSDSKRILVMDDVDHTVFVLVRKSNAWRILLSSDRGASFALRRTLTSEGDIWTPRTLPGPVYAVDGYQIYMTGDLGSTWTPVGHPIPGSGTRSVLACNEKPSIYFNVAYLESGTWKLWRSVDNGLIWTKVKNLLDFWESLAASTQDGDLIAYAGVEMFFSRNGGSTWKKVNNWGAYYNNPDVFLHADVPGLFVLPDPGVPAGEIWYIATDGGLYDSDDQMHSVRNLSLEGLGVSQYYTLLTSRRRPDLVLAGSQDQGYQRSVLNGPPPPPPGPWADFDQLISGDYGHLTSTNGAHDLVYSVYPGFVLVQEGEDNPSLLYPWVDFPAGESHLWMPYIQADPEDPESFFFCATKLYRYTRVSGAAWSYVQHSAQDFSPGYLTAIAFSPLDPNRAYAATSDGRLYHSNDGAKTWTQSLNSGPGSHYFYGTALLPSSKDVDVCWVAGSGYSNAPVFRTENGGGIWYPKSAGLPYTLVYCLCEAPDQSGALYCGSENGAWIFDPGTETWNDLLGVEAPITTYWACESVPSQNLVRFGTYGRGIWDYHAGTPGFFPYGELLGGSNILGIGGDAPPRIGQPALLKVNHCQPNALGAVALSLHSGKFPALGGTFLLDPQGMILFPVQADTKGDAALPLTLPYSPGIVGMDLFFQAGAQDPAQSQGYGLSHGLRGVIGD